MVQFATRLANLKIVSDVAGKAGYPRIEVDFLTAVSREIFGELGSPIPRITSCHIRDCISVSSYSNSRVKIDKNTVAGDGVLNKSFGLEDNKLSSPAGFDALISSKRE